MPYCTDENVLTLLIGWLIVPVTVVTDPAVACIVGLPGEFDCTPPPKLDPPPKIIVVIFSYYTINIFSRIYAVYVNEPGVVGLGVLYVNTV